MSRGLLVIAAGRQPFILIDVLRGVSLCNQSPPSGGLITINGSTCGVRVDPFPTRRVIVKGDIKASC